MERRQLSAKLLAGEVGILVENLYVQYIQQVCISYSLFKDRQNDIKDRINRRHWPFRFPESVNVSSQKAR